MGYYCHISVIFACDNYDGVAALAKRHIAMLQKIGDAYDYEDAVQFLSDMSRRSGGSHCGSKGGLATWGMVGNYVCGDKFVEVLRGFWQDLLGGIRGGPYSHEHVLVFYEPEQSEAATAYEISLTDGAVRVRKHACPFAWMQY